MNNELVISSLNHTWLIDIDGTIVKHNGYKLDGFDTVLPGVVEFWNSIPKEDTVILLTSRDGKYKNITESFLNENGLWFTSIIYNLPFGERIIINDKKPSGLKMSVAIDLKRDEGIDKSVVIDSNIWLWVRKQYGFDAYCNEVPNPERPDTFFEEV